jgi:hypothetical protein
LYSGRQLHAGVPLSETIFFGWPFLQATCFVKKGETSQNSDFIEEWYGNEQSGEQIVKAIVY